MSSAVRFILALITFLAAEGAGAVEILEGSIEQTYVLEREGTISINNADGSIRIYAADVAEVHLHALKKAYTEERLNGIKVDVRATPTSLAISTLMPPQKNRWTFADRSGTVDYTLIVPLHSRIARCDLVNGEMLVEGVQSGAAKAHLVNGWLAAHNCFVDLDLSIVNGKLDVSYDWWLPGAKFTANATSGTASLRALIPPDASVAIAAESEHGHVANTLAPDESEPKSDATSVAVAVGSGDGASITLRATNGNVRIDKAY